MKDAHCGRHLFCTRSWRDKMGDTHQKFDSFEQRVNEVAKAVKVYFPTSPLQAQK